MSYKEYKEYQDWKNQYLNVLILFTYLVGILVGVIATRLI